jgi:hypothetical protein
VKLVFLGVIFRQNSYTDQQSGWALNPPPSCSGAFLFYVRPAFNRISRVLCRHNIKSVVGLSARKISSFLPLVKENLGLKMPEVYSIP